MDDLISVIRDFIYRDLAFILGGTIVICSVAYAFRFWLPHCDLMSSPTWFLFLFAAMAYVVGYAVQDIGGVIGITFTGSVLDPNNFCRSLYKRFSHEPWRTVTDDLRRGFQFEVRMGRRDIPQVTLRDLERIVNFKVIGMCVGGCSLLASLILLGRWLFSWLFSQFAENFALGLGIPFLLIGSSLICLGWIKAMQEVQFLQAMSEENYPLLHGQYD